MKLTAILAALMLGALTDRAYIVTSLVSEANIHNARKIPPGGSRECLYSPAEVFMGLALPERYHCAEVDVQWDRAMWREAEHLVRRFGHINRYPEELVAP